jgi:glucokinase
MVMITLGTGIGGAFVVDGRLLIGPSGSIGEVGHHTIDIAGRKCGCGNYGCWEALCARDAIIERAERKLQAGRASLLTELAPRSEVTPELVSRAAADGDALALEVLEETGFYIGLGVANLINLMNPERFVIGGGIAQAGELLLAPVRRTVDRRAVPLQRRIAEIVPALLGDNAGVVGAAVLARDRVEGVTDII